MRETVDVRCIGILEASLRVAVQTDLIKTDV